MQGSFPPSCCLRAGVLSYPCRSIRRRVLTHPALLEATASGAMPELSDFQGWFQLVYCVHNWRNLAQNSHDVDGQQVLFPHASTNSGATDERFMARNAIDGVTQNCLHGAWPYSSWGTNKRDDAWLQIDFGRTVVAHELRLFLRADFPHDSWWKQATVTLSDGTSRIINLERTGQPQSFSLDASRIEWLRLENLVRGDESPFPALSQLQVWGVAQ